MVEDFIQVQPDSTGKKLRAIKQTVAGNDVESEVIVLSSDGSNTIDPRMIVDGAGSGALATVKSLATAAPANTDPGIIVQSLLYARSTTTQTPQPIMGLAYSQGVAPVTQMLGSQSQPLQQRASTNEALVQLRNAGFEIDPRDRNWTLGPLFGPTPDSIIALGAQNTALAQRPTTNEALVQLRSAGLEIDPRDQGAPNSLGNKWPVQLTDGTNSASVNAQGQLSVRLTNPSEALPANYGVAGWGRPAQKTWTATW